MGITVDRAMTPEFDGVRGWIVALQPTPDLTGGSVAILTAIYSFAPSFIVIPFLTREGGSRVELDARPCD